jgi:hypothetical protein
VGYTLVNFEFGRNAGGNAEMYIAAFLTDLFDFAERFDDACEHKG